LFTVVSTVAALTVLAFSPAAADPYFRPMAVDTAGVGDLVTQYLMNDLAAAYNATGPVSRVASFDGVNPATGQVGDQITVRPGVNLQRPATAAAAAESMIGHPEVDFARISRSPLPYGLVYLPFAMDDIGYVASRAGYAPQGLTTGQIRDIYTCRVTTWNQVGGSSTARIKPLLTPVDSEFWTTFRSVIYPEAPGACVKYTDIHGNPVTENDAAVVADDPAAIFPMSKPVAALTADYLGARYNTSGFSHLHKVYNAVRIDPDTYEIPQRLVPFFGTGVPEAAGWICGAQAKQIIMAAGFVPIDNCGEAEFGV
jgi:ABC-type phosphate transport system substrate-binding protein